MEEQSESFFMSSPTSLTWHTTYQQLVSQVKYGSGWDSLHILHGPNQGFIII
jgi:hypothetical protein